MTEVASSVPLQMTLGDVARLAKVQRPVVSVWRTRSAASAAPFPEPFATVRGEERFDADAVVEWLELTGRGNNPTMREDCAAFASPKGMSAQDDEIVFNSDLSAPTRTPWPTQARRRLRVHGVRYEPLTVNDDGTGR
ncbi:MAG: hypothetical protein ACRDSL_15980 [Pseudonocardiaceae bacterium]